MQNESSLLFSFPSGSNFGMSQSYEKTKAEQNKRKPLPTSPVGEEDKLFEFTVYSLLFYHFSTEGHRQSACCRQSRCKHKTKEIKAKCYGKEL